MSLNNEELMEYLLRDVKEIFKNEIERIDIVDDEKGKVEIEIFYKEGEV